MEEIWKLLLKEITENDYLMRTEDLFLYVSSSLYLDHKESEVVGFSLFSQ